MNPSRGSLLPILAGCRRLYDGRRTCKEGQAKGHWSGSGFQTLYPEGSKLQPDGSDPVAVRAYCYSAGWTLIASVPGGNYKNENFRKAYESTPGPSNYGAIEWFWRHDLTKLGATEMQVANKRGQRFTFDIQKFKAPLIFDDPEDAEANWCSTERNKNYGAIYGPKCPVVSHYQTHFACSTVRSLEIISCSYLLRANLLHYVRRGRVKNELEEAVRTFTV